jgi:hypothetical protein
MDNLIKEHKELFKNQLIDYINDSIDTTRKQLKSSVESCDINYFNGSLDILVELKNYIKEM